MNALGLVGAGVKWQRVKTKSSLPGSMVEGVGGKRKAKEPYKQSRRFGAEKKLSFQVQLKRKKNRVWGGFRM